MIHKLIVLVVLIIKNPKKFFRINFQLGLLQDANFIESTTTETKLVKVAPGWYTTIPDWVYNLGSRFSKNKVDKHLFWSKIIVGLDQWRFYKYKNFRE